MGYVENQQKIMEEKQKIKSKNDLEIMNAQKEKEKEKRNKKLIYTKAKFLLYDKLEEQAQKLTDYNELLYNNDLKDIIIENVTIKLFYEVLTYKYVSDELQEDVNFYLLEIYNTTANKIISIKNKQKKELERIEKEKQKEEYKKQLLSQYEEIMKEKEYQEKEKATKQKQEQKENTIAWIGTIFFIIILAYVIWHI